MKRTVLLLMTFFIVTLFYAKEKPNIVVFIADDAGMDFGCYGNKEIKTPNIDQLAQQGLTFENAFLTASQCSPSRTSMLSGQYAHTVGTEDLHTGIDDTTKLLPSYLSENGYLTGIMLKGHIGNNGMKQFDWYDQGFWPDYVQGKWFDKALDNFETFLNKTDGDPFFLWVGFVDPHRPYIEDKVKANRAPQVNDPKNIKVPPYLVDSDTTKIDLAHYYDEITRMDEQIGSMIELLERRNLRDNTIIIFLSDNGMPFPGAKGTCYDSGVQTPLIFAWDKKIPADKRHKNGLISTIDLSPTILDLAGIEKPQQMYGTSFRQILMDPTAKGRDFVFGERNWHGTDEHIRYVRTEDYKLILNSYIYLPHGTPSDLSTSLSWYELQKKRRNGAITDEQERLFEVPRPRVELYDIQNDPYESENMAFFKNYNHLADSLLKVLDEWRVATNDHPYYERRKGDRVDRVTGLPVNRRESERYE
jgi:arylsulfatase A-like enzyme